MNKLKIGILGASRGMDFAMRMLPDYEFAEITAVCETYPILLENAVISSVNRGNPYTAETTMTIC